MKRVGITLLAALAGVLSGGAGALACEGDKCANGLAYEAFGAAPGSGARPVLAVFVHGDVSAGGPADYMYNYARQFAAGRKDVVAVALLRPGYYDRTGHRSAGSDNGRRDTFHSGNNSAVAGAIRELKQRYGARSVVALGHSGGAGTLGVVAGNSPGLINGLVLVSCPCDVAAWSASRGRRPGAAQSPGDYLSGIPGGTPIVAVTGQSDDNTRPELAADYIAKAQARGLPAKVQIVGGGHGFGGALAGTSMSALGAMAR
ncbi:alpha/beta hydrolase [Bosea sp. F3-2]|uniref:alpha/beta fold hydrolase n=1 Tax=Bosea sp. F3-2 TaxID=2599640 RepID=UPI0011F03BB2|nr:alpha/beta hydrolase [Bosea sp. F3-2]QEL21687.1 alpha/beta hydrolase [Bosea sp. F3-2]